MRFLVRLFRLFIFSLLVSTSLLGTWIAVAIYSPDTTNLVSVYAWDAADYVLESAYYALEQAVDPNNTYKNEFLIAQAGERNSHSITDVPDLQATSTPTIATEGEVFECQPPADWSPYVVQADDSLASLAFETGTSEGELQQGNCLTTSELSPDQILYLPVSMNVTVTETVTTTREASSTLTSFPTSTLPATALTANTATPSATTIYYSPTFTPIPATNTPYPTNTFIPSSTHTSVPSVTTTPSTTPTLTTTNTPDGNATATSTPIPSLTSTPSPSQIPSSTATNSGPQPTATVDLSGCNYNTQSSFENQVLDLLNLEREKVGLLPLRMQSQLRNSARGHSADMACNDFVSHIGSNGTTSYDRITSAGYFPSWWGENIYMGWNATPEDVVTWWMNSTPHRNNILHSYYVHIGVGHADYGNTNAYTLNFGRP